MSPMNEKLSPEQNALLQEKTKELLPSFVRRLKQVASIDEAIAVFDSIDDSHLRKAISVAIPVDLKYYLANLAGFEVI